MDERPADRDGQQGAFDDVMTDKGDTYIDCYSHLFFACSKIKVTYRCHVIRCII